MWQKVQLRIEMATGYFEAVLLETVSFMEQIKAEYECMYIGNIQGRTFCTHHLLDLKHYYLNPSILLQFRHLHDLTRLVLMVIDMF